MKTFRWGFCDCCGGALPTIASDMDPADNTADELPRRLKHGGDCPGYFSPDGICGAYEGWDAPRIIRYVRRRGVRVT
jgi:hypothetical protein